ncbi:MAG: phosphoglycerate kinase [Candidatus Margulisiibacteriota bacterium]|nr:phosphoglycerate kinase [Candidatus Margulisiibacteriota bacterium]
MHNHSFSSLLSETIEGKVVLVRVDFNAPIKDGVVSDDTRLRASIDTIRSLTNKGAKVVLVSHLSRPGGKVVDSLRLNPIQLRLQELLQQDVKKVDDCIGDTVKTAILNLNNSEVLLLENIRFYAEEEANDEGFAKTLASYCDVFVQDAFGAVHRKHASTFGVAQFLPAYSGQLLDKELNYLSQILTAPDRPFTAIIGGPKISSKFSVLVNLLNSVDVMILGGAMVYTLLKAQGHSVGKSLVEDDLIPKAKEFLAEVKRLNKRLYLPEDHLVVSDFSQPETARIISEFSAEDIGVDIGPKSISAITDIIDSSNCVFWNGPVGVFETPEFSKGTFGIAEFLANANDTTTIVGGGDSIAAINAAGCADKIDHISTGGGASLEFLEGKQLPGITVLK